jgi:hypothetical protein
MRESRIRAFKKLAYLDISFLVLSREITCIILVIEDNRIPKTNYNAIIGIVCL